MNIRCNPSVLKGEITLKDKSFSNLILLCAGMLSEDGVTLKSFTLDEESKKLLDLIEYMGASVFVNENNVTVKKGRVFGMMTSVKENTQLFMLYCALASVCEKGFSLISGVRSIENSVVLNVVESLNKIHATNSFDDENELVIWGENEIIGGTVDAKGNCDFALAFALISSASALPIDILNVGDLLEKHPHFIESYNSLGGKIEVIK